MMVNGEATVILFSLIHNHRNFSCHIKFQWSKWLEKFIPTFIKYSVKDAKIYVIDNGSNDNSIAFLKENYQRNNYY